MTELAARGVTVTLGGNVIVRSVDLSVSAGDWLVMVGPNGAGKSTLLRALLGLVDHAGTVSIAGTDASTMAVRERAKRMAYVPQNAEIPTGTAVLDYVLLGRTPHLRRGLYLGDEDVGIAIDALDRLGLTGFAERDLMSLSGGERQLAVIARALAQQTTIFVLDEPTTALDIGHQQHVLATIERLRVDLGLTIVSSLHDLTLAADYGTELLMLADGAVVGNGAAADVLTPEAIAAHYGAAVDLIEHAGRTLVVPRRPEM